MDVAVDDGVAYAAMAADVDVGEDDAVIHFRIGIHADIRREHAFTDDTAGDDASRAYDGIDGRSGAAGFAKHKLGRRILPLLRADRPVFVIQVEHR